MRRTKQWVFILSLLLLCSSGLSQGKDTYSWGLSYSYGNLPLLSSLVTNAGLDLDENERYSDITMNGSISLTEQLHYELSVQATNQPPELINTKYARADYPISTGRIQKSVVNFKGEAFSIQLGRANMLNSNPRSDVFDHPISADGFSWDYTWEGWSFKHTFQVLPAEKESGQVFRRSVSYHHLAKTYGEFKMGGGEYLILTGENIGFDLKRLNPLLPYLVNSFDSEADTYPGYSGDSDNSIIKIFMEWTPAGAVYTLKLYVDEFQIDGEDREVLNDALLLSISGQHDLMLLGLRHGLHWGFSAANPNFGQHPGPFTTPSIGIYPLFETTPGMVNMAHFKMSSHLPHNLHASLGGYVCKWVDISNLPAWRMNRKAELEGLSAKTDSKFTLGVGYTLSDVPINFNLSGWIHEDPGVRMEIIFGKLD